MSDTTPMRRAFTLFTSGKRPDLDLLAIVVECMEGMDLVQRAAALGYLNARWRAELTTEEGE